jgi:hypothetical protein
VSGECVGGMCRGKKVKTYGFAIFELRVAGGGDEGERVVGVYGGHGGWCGLTLGVVAVILVLGNLLFLHFQGS